MLVTVGKSWRPNCMQRRRCSSARQAATSTMDSGTQPPPTFQRCDSHWKAKYTLAHAKAMKHRTMAKTSQPAGPCLAGLRIRHTASKKAIAIATMSFTFICCSVMSKVSPKYVLNNHICNTLPTNTFTPSILSKCRFSPRRTLSTSAALTSSAFLASASDFLPQRTSYLACIALLASIAEPSLANTKRFWAAISSKKAFRLGIIAVCAEYAHRMQVVPCTVSRFSSAVEAAFRSSCRL
mmetsp:Transcript_41456/g.95309  ORF Transcript_41456/g.95309 Transcript_41456/m.95309 type:complete len:238 (-) Transcript_41456:668-1381(-)